MGVHLRNCRRAAARAVWPEPAKAPAPILGCLPGRNTAFCFYPATGCVRVRDFFSVSGLPMPSVGGDQEERAADGRAPRPNGGLEQLLRGNGHAGFESGKIGKDCGRRGVSDDDHAATPFDAGMEHEIVDEAEILHRQSVRAA